MAAHVAFRSPLCSLSMLGAAKATLKRPAVLGCRPALLRRTPASWTNRPLRPKASSLHVTMSNLIPLPDYEPEGYLNQVAHALPMLLRDPVVMSGFLLASIATSKCLQLAITVPGPLGGKGLQIAAAALGGCIPVLFGFLAQLRFPQPTPAERAIKRVKRMKQKDFVDPETWQLIYEKVLDEERFYVNLHFGAQDDQDYYKDAVQRLKRDGLLPP